MDTPTSHDSPNAALDRSAHHLQAAADAALTDIASSARGLVRESAHAAEARALRLRDSGSALIRERPMQCVLVAAGAGAIAGLLLGLLMRGVAARH